MSDSMKETLEKAGRAKSLEQARKRFLIVFTSVVLALLFVLFLIEELFVVREIVVKSESPFYSAEEVVEATGISLGQKMFAFSAAETRMEVLRKLAYLSGVEVKKVFPSKVEITFEEIPGTMYVDVHDEHYILAPDFTVLARASDADIAAASRIHLITTGVLRCVVGEPIVLRDGAELDLLKEIYASFSEAEMVSRITYLDATNRFHIELNLDGRWDVDLGDSSELSYKAKMLRGVTESAADEYGQNALGKIDVSAAREAILQLYNEDAPAS